MEQVDVYKYLGSDTDHHLSFAHHADSICKKAQQHLFLLRRLEGLRVRQDILTTIYKSLTESAPSLGTIFSPEESKKKLTRIIKQATKITGSTQTQLSELYSRTAERKAVCITEDRSRPLHRSFQPLPSELQSTSSQKENIQELFYSISYMHFK